MLMETKQIKLDVFVRSLCERWDCFFFVLLNKI